MTDERQPVRGRRQVLNERILRILRMAALGLTDSEIAFALGISEHTVKTHLKIALRALEATNKPQAIHICHRRGLFEERNQAA